MIDLLSHPVGVLVVGLVAALLSWLLTPAVARLAVLVGALDVPDARKVHREPTPRLGGLAVVGAAGIVLLALVALPGALDRPASERAVQGLVLGLIPILLVSIWDDIRGVGAWWKFLCHAVGAAVAVAFGTSLPETVHLFGQPVQIGWLAVPLTMFWLVLGTSAFNLIDGLDGLSAGLGLISASALAGVFAIAGQAEMTLVAVVLAGALLGFLPHNVHPARIFLGDTGATAIGFSLASMVVVGGATLSSGLAVAMPILIMGLPIADTAVAVLRRSARRLVFGKGAAVFTADRDHVHHKLLALGVTHARAVLILWAFGALCAGMAMLSVTLTSQRTGLLLGGLLAAGLIGLSRLGYEEFALVRRGVVVRFYDAPVLRKSLFAVLVDFMTASAATWAAFGLKFDDWGLVVHRADFFSLAAAMGITTVVAFWALGLYRGSWRVAGLSDFVRLGQGIALSCAAGYLFVPFVTGDWARPSVVFILAMVQLVLAAGARVSYRVIADPDSRTAAGEPVIIYGAGKGGVAALRELLSNPAIGMKPVAFLDDNPATWGRTVQGVPVVGGVDSAAEAIRRFRASRVLVSTGKLPERLIRDVRATCAQHQVEVLRVGVSIRPLDGATPGSSATGVGVIRSGSTAKPQFVPHPTREAEASEASLTAPAPARGARL